MSTAANVRSSRALADFSASLATFRSQSLDGLSSVDLEIRRTIDWLEEQRQTWVRVMRKVEEDYTRARQELARRKMMRIGDRPVATSDQELAFAKAKARLEYVQEKLAKTHGWQQLLPQLVLDHQGPLKVLANSLETEVPRMRAFLDQKIAELNEYAREQP